MTASSLAAATPAAEAPPSALSLLLEARAPIEWGSAMAAWPLLRSFGAWPRASAPAQAVIVYPGLAAGDYSTLPLRSFVADLGYRVHGWDLGMNRGPGRGVLERLQSQLRAVCEESGGPVSLVGWSLGGLYARELAKLMPECARQVITMGTPFAQSARATNALRVYTFLSSEPLPDAAQQSALAVAPLCPTTSVFTRSDGVVAWTASQQAPSTLNARTENVEVFASHIGLGINPAAWYVVADRLAQGAATWQPFRPPLGFGVAFPSR